MSRCNYVNPQVSTTLLVLEAVVLVIGARLCWAVKNAPDALNETKFIAAGKSFHSFNLSSLIICL